MLAALPVPVPFTAVMVADGWASLQLWMSSLPSFGAVPPVLPPMKTSTFQLAALLLILDCLASSGVQLVASLPDTLSVICDALLDLPTYHEGTKSTDGLGMTCPRPVLTRTTYADAVLTPAGIFQLSVGVALPTRSSAPYMKFFMIGPVIFSGWPE